MRRHSSLISYQCQQYDLFFITNTSISIHGCTLLPHRRTLVLVTSPVLNNSEVSHQYEYDNDNEHVINYFSNNQMLAFASGKCRHIETNQQNYVRLECHKLVWTEWREMTSWFVRMYPQSDDVFVIVIVFVLVRNLPIVLGVHTPCRPNPDWLLLGFCKIHRKNVNLTFLIWKLSLIMGIVIRKIRQG
jgi:hypothetical protein